jgi:hypothetical protein
MIGWLGEIIKKDIGEDGTSGRSQQQNKQKCDDDGDEDALGADSGASSRPILNDTSPHSVLQGSWNSFPIRIRSSRRILQRIRN